MDFEEDLAPGPLSDGFKEAQRDLVRRDFYNEHKFWRGCPDARCRRHRLCLDDTDGCERRGWPTLRPADTVWLGAMFEELSQCFYVPRARRAANAALRHWQRVRRWEIRKQL